jgi:hypothetical protein
MSNNTTTTATNTEKKTESSDQEATETPMTRQNIPTIIVTCYDDDVDSIGNKENQNQTTIVSPRRFIIVTPADQEFSAISELEVPTAANTNRIIPPPLTQDVMAHYSDIALPHSLLQPPQSVYSLRREGQGSTELDERDGEPKKVTGNIVWWVVFGVCFCVSLWLG